MYSVIICQEKISLDYNQEVSLCIFKVWKEGSIKQKEGCREGMEWEFGVSRCKPAYTEWINKILLYGTGNYIQYPVIGTSLVVQELRLHTPNAGDLGSISGQGTRSHMPTLKIKDPVYHS